MCGPVGLCHPSSGWVWSLQWVGVVPPVTFNSSSEDHPVLPLQAATIYAMSSFYPQPFIVHFLWHAGRFPLLNITLRCTMFLCWCLNDYLAPPLSTRTPTWTTPTVNHQQWGCPRHCRLAWCVSLTYFYCLVEAYVWYYCRGSLLRWDNRQIHLDVTAVDKGLHGRKVLQSVAIDWLILLHKICSSRCIPQYACYGVELIVNQSCCRGG